MNRRSMRGLFLLLPLLAGACAVGTDRVTSIAVGLPRRSAPPVEDAAPEPLASPAQPPRLLDIGKSYTIVKAGTFLPEGDLKDLDDGFSGELIFGRSLLSFLALEGSLGYFGADGQYGAARFELDAIPLFINARAGVPILFFEPYVGVGVGGIFADYKASNVLSGNDFVLAYAGFIGLEFGLGRLAVGAEYKYIQSEDTKDDFSIEGATASVFVSVPF
ncbi:MAG TPA: hypothetical protein VFZ65_05525 [Planctomycetota bacterium]|nr:hypothetical protein [Planctomycetota bacterium]